MVKEISDNEVYLFIKYIKSVLWRVAKRLSYIQDARCLKVNTTWLPLHSFYICIQSLLMTHWTKACSVVKTNNVCQWIVIAADTFSFIDIYKETEGLTFVGPCVVIYSYSTTNKMLLFLKLFILVKRCTCFRRSFHPSSGAPNCTYACCRMCSFELLMLDRKTFQNM